LEKVGSGEVGVVDLRLQRATGCHHGVLSGTGKPNIIVGSPLEFKGKPDNWAPEELLVGSVNTCILLTFLTLAQGRGLIPAAYESEAEGLLENVEGKYLITEVTVRPRITIKSQADVGPIRERAPNPVVSCRVRWGRK